MEKWWQLEPNEVALKLSTHLEAGLGGQEAGSRLKRYGPNQLAQKKGHSALHIFLEQFNDFIIWVLIGAALVSGFLKEWVDALAIIGIIFLNAVLGFIQEFRAEKSLEALKKLSSPTTKVIRDNALQVISSVEIVPGDLVELEAGDNVPADSRLVYTTSNFSSHEASLTGESTSVLKTSIPLKEEEISLGDRANMVYMGTSVVSGKGRALVIDTGMQTELGKIAGLIQKVEEDTTPLQKRLEQFGKFIVYICFALVAMVFVLGFIRGGKVFDLFMTSVSLAVAAIPEGLPAVVTIALALGVQRMVRRNCLIRKLPSVETLGCTTVICSDKTGTLTRNEMTVQAVYLPELYLRVSGIGYEPKGDFSLDGRSVGLAEYPGLSRLLTTSVLCNGARLAKESGAYKIIGDPTEGALLAMAAKAGIFKDDKESEFPFHEEIPFDSDRKQMTIIRRKGSSYVAFVKGAPDVMLANCTHIQDAAGKIRPIGEQDRKNVLEANAKLTNQAMRVLALALREMDSIPAGHDSSSIEKELVFCGLAAMIDPPREEVKQAMASCRSAGIRSVMITGDHKNTAVAVARELGFYKEDSLALTGDELDKVDDQELDLKVARIAVYARVSPEHKLRIVRAWRGRGEIVAMTGDGVNDAPALKEADIGVAMGITGTDVTKEVSDMVITDDNFASIVAAVEEGRGIYDNIRKFIHYLLSCNAGEMLTMFVASLVALPVPLLPIHILWVNLVTDGFPALALGVDPIDKKIMQRSPRPKDEPVVTKKIGWLIITQGAFIAFCSLLAFWFVLFVEDEGIGRARTACFIVLSCSQLFHAYNCRSMRESIFGIGFLTNKKLIVATLFSFCLQMAVVYVPFFQTIFKTEPLGVLDWVLVIVISSFPLWAMETVKLFTGKAGKAS